MKDNRFIELVNLYVDRQITAAETAELEAEIQANPRRRAIYRQYCQLHSATKQVYSSFRTSTDEAPANRPAGRAVIADFASHRPPSARWRYYASGLAVAACLALIFVRQNPADQPAAGMPARGEVVTLAEAATVLAQEPEPARTFATTPAPGLISLRHTLSGEPDYAALLTTLRQEDQRIFANGQMPAGRRPSLFDDGVFEAPQFLPASSPRVFRGKQAPNQAAEFTAFQFQR